MTRENCKIMKQFRDTDYYVTEDGRVISTKFGKTKELKQQIGPKDYLKTSLYINNKSCTIRIHRLVAECFIPNPDNLPQVNHKDTDKSNNHVLNLEWVTNNENIKHATENGLMRKGIKHPSSILTEQQVIWIRNNCIPNDKEFGVRPLSRKFNVSKGCIDGIIHNRRWKHLD